MDFMTGNIDLFLFLSRDVDQKNSQYLVWPPFASCSMTHLLRIELIRMLIVACGMLSHSSSMAVQSCWIMAGTGTRCRTRRSRASQTCSMGDVWRVCRPLMNWDIFSFQELCTDPCDMGLCIIMPKHELMAADEWHDNGPQDRVTVSVHSNCHQSNAIVFYVRSLCLPIPSRHDGALGSQRWHQQTAHPHDAIDVICSCEVGWTYCQIL